MQLLVKMGTGKTVIRLNVKPESTIQDVKRKITNEVGRPTEQQQLFFHDQELKYDEGSLRIHNVERDSTLLFIPILKIHFKRLTGKKITLEAVSQDTIEKAKKRIFQKEGIAMERLGIFFAGKRNSTVRTLLKTTTFKTNRYCIVTCKSSLRH